ncbi:MAG: hypothetical protein ACOC7U_04285 [Spirochaetota bacterium]
MVFFLGLVCVVGGFIIVVPLFTEKHPVLKTIDEKLSPYKIIIGLAVLVIGVVAFIAPYHSPGRALIPIFGDFFPSVFAILCGMLISVDFLETVKGIPGSFLEKLKSVLGRYQFPVGFASIFFGVVHWFLFKIPFF